jgi:hypothetical protein
MKRRALLASITFVVPALAAIGVGACSSSKSGDDSSIAPDSGSQTDSTVADTGPTKPTEAGVDAAPKKYCASDSVIVDAGPDADAIAPAVPQSFDSKMAGCPGVVSYTDRATLCAASCQPCSAVDWVTRHGSTAPAYDYWTDDNLGYSGNFEVGEACTASPFPPDAATPGPGACESFLPDGGPLLAPMRVCIDNNADPFADPSTDGVGNQCNWNKCAFEIDLTIPTVVDAGPDAAPLVFDHMGGCDDNNTAGTLCCCE